jgi:uncharacterized membrane protein
VLTKQQGGKIMLADILKPFSAKGNRLGLFRLALYQMGAGILIALSIYFTSFAYAVPLVYFNKEQRILNALKSSFMVFYYNILPLSVYGIICALLIVVSMFLSLLPLLILMPICYISFFVSYQAIFMPVVPPSDDSNIKPLSSEQSGRFDA